MISTKLQLVTTKWQRGTYATVCIEFYLILFLYDFFYSDLKKKSHCLVLILNLHVLIFPTRNIYESWNLQKKKHLKLCFPDCLQCTVK